jgi:Flp pilus assembly pilin Flp
MWERLYLYLRMMLGELDSTEGQGITEYAMILGFASIVAVVVLTSIGSSVENLLNSILPF